MDDSSRTELTHHTGIQKKIEKNGFFYSILNFNPLKFYVQEKHRHYLHIFSSGRHGCHVAQNLKLAHCRRPCNDE